MFKQYRTLMIVVFLVLLILSAAVAACASQSPTPATIQQPISSTNGTDYLAADTSPIVIGVVAPMTGDLADFGVQITRGVGMAMDEINAKGGVNGRKLEMKACDDMCNTQLAAACAGQMTNDPSIFAVIGHICSSTTLAGGPIYDAAGVTLLNVNSSNPKITEQGWKHVFRSTPTDDQQGAQMAAFAIERLGAKKIAIIYSNDDYGLGLAEAAAAQIKIYGAELVAEETFTTGQDKDFSAQLNRIAQADPDMLYIMAQYGEAGLIANQRMRVGLSEVSVMASAASQHQEFIELAGDGAEGVFIAVYYSLSKDTPQNQELVQKVVDKYGEKPGEQVPWGYDGVYILAQAIEAGATKDTLPQFLSKVDYQGVTGHIVFDENNQVQGLTGDIEVIRNGEFTPFTR